jgi:hypothetical protein
VPRRCGWIDRRAGTPVSPIGLVPAVSRGPTHSIIGVGPGLAECPMISGPMGSHHSNSVTYAREPEGRAQGMRLCSLSRLWGGREMRRYGFIWLVVAMLPTGLGLGATAQRAPEGQLTIAFDTSIASTYLDPAEATGIATPFVFLYTLHDALIKPLPGNNMAACLAESWAESEDGLTYEFQLRQGLTFHNGDPFTAEDVQFSFLRYKGTSAKLLHERVKAVEVVDAHRVRFSLHAP